MERYRMPPKINGTLSQSSLLSNSHLNPLKLHRPAADAEISIFDADRYFNDHPTRPTIILEPVPEVYNPTSPVVDTNNRKRPPFPATPTASSEASWNSQSGLLTNASNPVAIDIKNVSLSPTTSSPRRLSWLNCRCFGKKSINVEETNIRKLPETLKTSPQVQDTHDSHTSFSSKIQRSGENKNSPPRNGEMKKTKVVAGAGAGAGYHLSPENNFPGSISGRIATTPRFSIPIQPPIYPDPARESLEVFQPPSLRKPSPDRPPHRPADDEDALSDKSSDLFEIESFSTQMTYEGRQSTSSSAAGILQLRRSMEEYCYPPSEVSVEWSVTTAEGIDRVSVANYSECGDLGFIEEENGNGYGGGAGAALWRRRGLMSCVSDMVGRTKPVPECRAREMVPRMAGRDSHGIARSNSDRITHPVRKRFLVSR